MARNTAKFGSIGWFVTMNVSRARHTVSADSKKFKELVDSMTVSGWQDGPEHAPTVGPLSLVSKDVIKTEEDRRRSEISLAERRVAGAPGDAAAAAHLDVLREAYCNPDGSLIKITHWGVTGHCRSAAAILAATARKLGNLPENIEGDVPTSFNWNIPVDVRQFTTLADAYVAQVIENEKKDLGFSRPTPVERLNSAKTLYDQSVSQSRLRDAYKASEGQRLWCVLRLDGRFPTLKIFERLTMSKADLDKLSIDRPKLDLTPMTPTDLIALRRQAFPDELDALNRQRRERGEPDLPLLSEPECEERLVKMSKGQGPSSTGMTKKQFGEWYGQVSGNPMAAAALDAARTNDTNSSPILNETAEACVGIMGLHTNLTPEQWKYVSVRLGNLRLVTTTEFDALMEALDKVINPLLIKAKAKADTAPVEEEDEEDEDSPAFDEEEDVTDDTLAPSVPAASKGRRVKK